MDFLRRVALGFSNVSRALIFKGEMPLDFPSFDFQSEAALGIFALGFPKVSCPWISKGEVDFQR